MAVSVAVAAAIDAADRDALPARPAAMAGAERDADKMAEFAPNLAAWRTKEFMVLINRNWRGEKGSDQRFRREARN